MRDAGLVLIAYCVCASVLVLRPVACAQRSIGLFGEKTAESCAVVHFVVDERGAN